MRIFIEVVAIYVMYVFGTSLLIWRFSTKDRGPSIIVASVVPFLFVFSLFETVFSVVFGSAPKIGSCPVGLSSAEILIEERRKEMFGGESLVPHFASDWSRLYAKTVAIEAERVQTFARRVLAVA